jgi:hypothetical protein
VVQREASERQVRNGERRHRAGAQEHPLRLLSPLGPLCPLQTRSQLHSRHAYTPNAKRQTLLPVRYPDILYLRGMPQEFFALDLFRFEPVARLTVCDPGCLKITG